MQEIWKDVVGYEGIYKVSNTGKIRSLPRMDNCGRRHLGRMRKTKKNNRGYVQINLSKEGISKYSLLHRIVAETFIDNPNNYPQVNHKDEDKNNNRADNLEWCTNIYNRHYGTGYQRSVDKHDYQRIADSNRKNVLQLDLNGNVIKKWKGVLTIERATGICESSIRSCCYGKQNSAGGFIWRYIERDNAVENKAEVC